MLDYALVRMTKLVDNLVVDSARMRANLAATRGLVFSQAVLLALIEEGMSRDDAYRTVQRNAMQAWDEGTPLANLLIADPEIPLDPEILSECFSLDRFLHATGAVFDRLEPVVVD